ncbi:MAG: maltose ABC transporter permease [Anaerolineaceae bacterium]|nr:maltose ABC transporter permease [Anaerolineaceae bacterium]
MSSQATAPAKPQRDTSARTYAQELRRKHPRRLISRLILIAITIVYALFPVVWIVSVSLNPANTNVVRQIIPANATLQWYEQLLNGSGFPFLTWLWNSILISFITMIISLGISTFGAFALSRFRFYGRKTTLLTVFLVQVFPSSLLTIAIFNIVLQLGEHVPAVGLNSHGGAILVYLGGALGINTWLLKGFFDTVPREIDEAAIIDGASHWVMFWRIIFPLVRPILAVVAILIFIATYNDYIIALTLLKDTSQQTLAVGLNLFISDTGTDWGLFAAGALLGAIPIVVLYLFVQDYIVGGLTSGAVKG